MKRSACISRTFFRRPMVRELVPDLKLLLAVITVGSESHVGCWIPAGLDEDSGLQKDALAGGLDDLERRRLIMRDRETGELFVVGWFRDNTYSSPARIRQAEDGLARVHSRTLRIAILESISKSPECGLDSIKMSKCFEKQCLANQGEGEGKGKDKGAFLQKASAHADAKKKEAVSGVTCWTTEDRLQVGALVAEHGVEAIESAGKKLAEQGVEPLPSRVQKHLEGDIDNADKNYSTAGTGGLDLGAILANSHKYYGHDGYEQEIEGEVVR